RCLGYIGRLWRLGLGFARCTLSLAIGGAPVVPVSYARVFQRHAKSRLWYPYTAYLHIRCCCEWLRGDDAALGHLALAFPVIASGR
ncbi:uncharacterized protein CCOS01_09475, partial [Colletotrichum costaricense]